MRATNFSPLLPPNLVQQLEEVAVVLEAALREDEDDHVRVDDRPAALDAQPLMVVDCGCGFQFAFVCPTPFHSPASGT